LEKWFLGKCSSAFYWFQSERILDKSNKWDIIPPTKANLPVFHYSIIPQARQERRTQKYHIFSIGCRISETSIYGFSAFRLVASWFVDKVMV
jgi:hypothetical protein